LAVTDALIRAADIQTGKINVEPTQIAAAATKEESKPIKENRLARKRHRLKDSRADTCLDPQRQPEEQKSETLRRSRAEGCLDDNHPLPTMVGKEETTEPELKDLWPEGAAAKASLQTWCESEGVPGPNEWEEEGHRQRLPALQPGFGLVNKPIADNLQEWKSSKGQKAIQDERQKHEDRKTWDLSQVVELSTLLKETRAAGEEVILGGVHPVMYEKHAEDVDKSKIRARVVFTAPRARTTSGFSPHALYNEISSAPVTFQAARASRAVGALRGFVGSTRDAEAAFLQAPLKRKDSARTFVSLPKAF
jgi:hypothetical protein